MFDLLLGDRVFLWVLLVKNTNKGGGAANPNKGRRDANKGGEGERQDFDTI